MAATMTHTHNQSPLIVITGPTASGKSSLALALAKKWHGEIICADSRTVYRGMDIGTAKPSRQDRDQVPHHLLDVVEPGETFTACLLYTSPSPRDRTRSRMPSSA